MLSTYKWERNKMRDIGDNVFWSIVWLVSGSVAMTLILSIKLHSDNVTHEIANAKSCEQAVILESNDSEKLPYKIMACKGLPQQIIVSKTEQIQKSN